MLHSLRGKLVLLYLPGVYNFDFTTAPIPINQQWQNSRFEGGRGMLIVLENPANLTILEILILTNHTCTRFGQVVTCLYKPKLSNSLKLIR
ncbi:hypothetical protein L1278_002404 [Pontibacter sp. HSC-36F09]|nr:hypothetical protein [Pontibacter sp. HSC-36F09]